MEIKEIVQPKTGLTFYSADFQGYRKFVHDLIIFIYEIWTDINFVANKESLEHQNNLHS